jgi:hypothetical protein
MENQKAMKRAKEKEERSIDKSEIIIDNFAEKFFRVFYAFSVRC